MFHNATAARRRISVMIGVLVSLGLIMNSDDVLGQDDATEIPGRYVNVPLPTLGGKQFWTDFQWNDGWRLQQNAITKHWRLLSPKNIRYAWGSRAACEARMRERIDPDRPADRRIVVLAHGLLRSSQSMAPLGRVLEEQGVVRPVAFEYASTRCGIAEHAAALRQWVESLPGEPRIDFVGHSMGNIVIRHALADWQSNGDPRGVLGRMDRFAMLGPPNQGAEIARQLSKLGLFEFVTGQGGMELGPAWEAFEARLATPRCPFMIVAGDLSESWMRNPLIDGPSDLVVRLEEAHLPGCAEMHRVPVPHSILMNSSQVQQLVVDFLKRDPVPAP